MPEIRTKRLLLRPYTTGDKSGYLDLVTDPEVMKYVDEGVVNFEKALVWWDRLINKQYPHGHRWCVVDGKEYAGHAMINYTRPNNGCELGYILPKSKWSRGFATEIAQALADYSREALELQEIFATVDEGHEESVRVLEKIGMKFAGYDYDDDGRFLVYVLKHE
ncbi:MAG: GNAT family N-acetyltransferase [Pyrinomonadaceae bacterium]|nr:GNAT family N-acetyltransferase [Pyrinomonadaceae bacterium]